MTNINDMFAKGGYVRANGVMIRAMYVTTLNDGAGGGSPRAIDCSELGTVCFFVSVTRLFH
jgi:hypothetical protein